MSKGGYVEDFTSLYGCFRCGEINGDIKEDLDQRYICDNCGERGVVTFVNALDILNETYIRGYIDINHEMLLDVELDLEDIDDTEE